VTATATEAGQIALVLLFEVMRLCSVSCNVLFRDLVSKQKNALGPDLTGNVQLVLTDPPYNMRRQKDKVNSAYDTLISDKLIEDGPVIT
jgi:16S rRNA G966 N2-methylase RsmD